MVNELVIKKASVIDAEALKKISVDTFIETFASQNTKEDMDLFLNECFNIKAIETELLDKNISYYRASLNENLVGYVKIRVGGHPDFNNAKALEIARIYVYETYHGQKVGASLMQFVMDFAKKNKFEVLWLGVWENNPKAIKFYERRGFEVFGNHIFRLGKDEQNDLLMRKFME